ncbi:MAG: CotH kinase family protein [Bacteroidota bacterium]
MPGLIRSFICLLLLMPVLQIYAQQITINEALSSNSTLFDEDQDTPDWFELHNTTSNPLVLAGWTISDREDNPTKWTLPNIVIDANEYLLIWASGKDRRETTNSRTLIDRNEDWKYIVPNQSVNFSWVELEFDDSNWLIGKSGFGYSDNDDATEIPTGSRSVFMRKIFTIEDINKVEELILDIDYDDSFVAYINGQEIARANIEGFPPSYNATSITDREAQIYAGGRPERFFASASLLQNGQNVLCIQAHNVSATSSDFSVIPFLSASYLEFTNEGIDPPEILNLSETFLHTNYRLSNEETLFLFDADGNEVDRLELGVLPPNVSIGRKATDQTIALFDSPTPGAPNDGNDYSGYLNESVRFSHPGGMTENLQLELSSDNLQDVIRYTLDATVPNMNSSMYQNPISINETTIVRARIFREGYLPSRTESRSYLVNVSHDLPIVSLITDPDNLFDDEEGIYAFGKNYSEEFPHFGSNFWEDWERDLNFTLYEEDNSIGVNLDAGVKIFGGWSRGLDQRSFSIFARGQYGFNAIDYPLFPDNEYDTYQALVLRNSGNDFMRSNIRDITLTSLLDGSGLETQAYRTVATYINGEYWGLYNMREKVNEHFLASKQGVDPEGLDILGPFGEIIQGSDEDYRNLLSFLEINSLVSDSNYDFVTDQIDIENFIIYNIAQIYFNNTDWPGNNIKYWKPENGKWRWILFDTDFGFGIWNPFAHFSNTLDFALEPNGPPWPNPPESTLLLRRLVENQQFRHQFINRFADELNTRFVPEKVEAHILEVADRVNAEMTRHFARWGGSISFQNEQVEVMTNFARQRSGNVKSHIRNTFGLPAFHALTLQKNLPSAGYIQLNSLTIEDSNWQGDYFETVPIKITAVARPGYTFSHWEGDSNSSDPVLVIDMQSNMNLNAVFEVSDEVRSIVINEINYRSSEMDDAGDWVELYNPNDEVLDISNWVFTDAEIDEGYVIPEGTIIDRQDFIVLTRDKAKFNAVHPNVANVIGDFDFGLSSEGDLLRIYDHSQKLIDSVQYFSSDPWPELADGMGYTLELRSPDLDNALAESWASRNMNGSPGRFNSDPTFTIEESAVELFRLFPNPTVDRTTLEINLQKPVTIDISLYNVQGERLRKLINDKVQTRKYRCMLDMTSYEPGLYLVKLITNHEVKELKLLKI